MMINALNSGARVFMADFEDALSPTWANVVGGQAALLDAVRADARVRIARGQGVPARRADSRRCSSGRAAGTSSSARAGRRRAGLGVSLFDFGLYLFHNGAEALRRGDRPVLLSAEAGGRTSRRGSGTTCSSAAQEALGIPRGSIRATVLIETILAAFEMEEILYELREHAAGLNAGRWDYLFSASRSSGRRPTLRRPIAPS